MKKNALLLLCLAVFAAGFLAYANTMNNGFLWDDEYLIINNPQIKGLANIPQIFKTYVGYGSENINNFYRPVQELSNMIDYRVWGLFAGGFHFTNVVLHSLCSLLIFLFLALLTGNRPVAFITAILSAVHPVHGQSVSYIAGRADILYFCFLLLSLIFYLRSGTAGQGRRDLLYALSLLFFALSLLSKEMAIVTPLLVLLCVFFFRDKDAKKIPAGILPFFAIAFIYSILRLTVLNFSSVSIASPYIKIPPVMRLLTFVKTTAVYLKILVLPNDLHMERTIGTAQALLSPDVLFSFTIFCLALWLIFLTYKKGARIVSFGIAWFYISLLPVSNIVPINSFISENWLYAASIGPFLVAGYLLSRLPKKAPSYCFIVLIILLYGSVTVHRNTEWHDEISFFRNALKYDPHNERLHLNLGNTFYEQKNLTAAIREYTAAIKINPKYAPAYANMGALCLDKNDLKTAEKFLQKAVKLDDNSPIAHYNLGMVYFEQKRPKKALLEFKKTVKQLPQFSKAREMLKKIQE